jgi:preprotein translocase subunit SecD
VDLSFDSTARQSFADVTQQLAGTGQQFAIVLDGEVISAPVVNQPIPGGNAQISGDFTQEEAQTLANSLKYGALPLKFTAPVVTEEGPSLASDQLAAGIWPACGPRHGARLLPDHYAARPGRPGAADGGRITYATVLVMSGGVRFPTLPGIAGLIGVGIPRTVHRLPRIRDEMRDEVERVAVGRAGSAPGPPASP